MTKANKLARSQHSARSYQEKAHPFTSLFAEEALSHVELNHDSRVLDIATGTGALALAAARSGAKIVAIDSSPDMIAAVNAAELPNVEALVMNGEALDFANGQFDAVFSIFGITLFSDWVKGLSEMRRVTRPDGYGVIATWQDRGAAEFLLLGQIRQKLFPDLLGMQMPGGLLALNNEKKLIHALKVAGYRNTTIEFVTHEYSLELTAMAQPPTLFGSLPDWTSLSQEAKVDVMHEIERMADGKQSLSVPSTALIAVSTL